MYDYTQMELFKIENVDHEIHILGITMSSLLQVIYVYPLSLILCGAFSPIFVAVYLLMCRKFFLARERGEPIEYRASFLKISLLFPFFASLFGLDRIIYSEGWYRE